MAGCATGDKRTHSDQDVILAKAKAGMTENDWISARR
jgi:hypothetical protein